MLLKRLVVFGVMVAASLAWARPEVRTNTNSSSSTSLGAAATAAMGDSSAPSMGMNTAGPGLNAAAPVVVGGNLEPRKALPKAKVVKRPAGESQLVVKFADAVKARANADRSVRAARMEDADPINAIAQQFGIQFVPAIKRSEQDLRTLEQRAEAYSGKAQPDLAGMMHIVGPQNKLEAAANELVKLDVVEFIYFEPVLRPHWGPPIGACVHPDLLGGGSTCTDDLDEVTCNGMGGCWLGENTTCDQLGCGDGSVNPDCGALVDCCVPHGLSFCGNEDCCELVCQVRPFCCDQFGGWDEICVSIANLFCDLNEPWPFQDCPNRCESVINGECFEVHFTAGCNDNTCCTTVCDLDAFCCDFFWDSLCVSLAFGNCIPACGVASTPDFVPLQGYLRDTSYPAQIGGLPGGPCGNLCPPAAVQFPGSFGIGSFDGVGSSLFSNAVLNDDPNLPAPERYQGLYGLGRSLHENYGVGTQNQARGKTVKVAVIEWAFYKDHEDLDVIPEPGQTMIMEPFTEPDHATACLGIIGATENGIGVTGIAPDCQLYFFPLTSIEEGPRFETAFTNCYLTLGPGDVVSCSFGPGAPFYNINNTPGFWALLRLGSDLGITTCLSAGNDCAQLDELVAEDLGDSGAVVVGACSPGRQFCRLVFSNFYQEGDAGPGGNSNVVHCSAWGTCVTSTGYGGLWFPNGDKNRAYTNGFGGTSAAAPQIAGMAACLQGLAKQFYGIPLAPHAVRAVLQNGYPQCGIFNPDDLPGFSDEVPCGPDTNPDLGPHRIGVYSEPLFGAGQMLSQSYGGFDDSPFVDDITIIRGTHMFGNAFSVKGLDDMYFTVASLYTPRRHRPDVVGPGDQVQYMASGQTVDLMIHASLLQLTQTLTITSEIQPPGPSVFYLAELYDWTINRWTFVDFAFVLGGNGGCVNIPGVNDNAVDFCYPHLPVTNATRFIRPHDYQVRFRAYYVAPGMVNGGFGGEPDNFVIRMDWIGLGVGSQVIGPPSPP